jgi:multidrug resistance protein, MATE family
MLKPFLKNSHTRETVYLAWPIILTQVGHVVTGMVDNIFLGQIGVTEQAAGILSVNLYTLVLVFCIGVSYASTPLITNAHENNDLFKKASLFKNSLFLNVFVAIACFLVLFFASDLLNYMRQPAEVVTLAIPFFDVLILSIIPISLFFTCKQYCEGLSNTKIALIISIIGNIINVILNYLLIYGKFGFPEMGYMGAAWASLTARVFMGVCFVIVIFKSPVTNEIARVYKQVKITWTEQMNLGKIGFNAGMQFTIEVAAFAIAGFMAGSFGKEQIDSHGIALSIAALTYMFGSGISSAATIRVGVFNAQKNWLEIKNASRIAIQLVLFVMGAFGIILLLFNNYLPLAFTGETQIISLAAKLLIIAALFQLFGVLRGLEDVKVPTVIALVGYWLIALPLSYLLAFNLKLETVGIWIGLLVALMTVSGGLLWRLHYVLKKNGM